MEGIIDLTGVSSGSDIPPVPEVAVVLPLPSPPAAVKGKGKKNPIATGSGVAAEKNLKAARNPRNKGKAGAAKSNGDYINVADKASGEASPGVKLNKATREQASKANQKYLASDVPWGRLVALKNCKAVVRGRQWDLTENDRGLTQIGRNHASHVQFLDLTISGLHLEMHPKIDTNGVLKKVELIDKSSNGTWLNGKRMTKAKPTLIRSGDVFSLVQDYRASGENVAAFVFSAIRNSRGESVRFFQQYRLGRELGRGTYATVRKCTERETDQVYAVKIIDLNSGRAQGWEIKELIKNAKNEAAMQQELTHPNVIEVKELFIDEEAGTVYIVMEYMVGGELFNQLRRHGCYTERKAKLIMRQILSACAFMNSKGITHRDMKPANILLSEDNGTTVKIADFGVAVRKTKNMNTYTGSPMYFAPEVLRRKLHPKSVSGQTYSCSSDMWSVGVIMFNLLCARNPWTATEFEQTLEDSPFDIDKKRPWPKISAAAKDLLRKLWNPDHEERIEAKDALRHPWLKGTKEVIPGESAGVPLSLGNCPVPPSERIKKRKREDEDIGGSAKKKAPNSF